MLPKNRNVVTPDEFDRLFREEAAIAEFSSTDEEAAFEKRDTELVAHIRRVVEQCFSTNEPDDLFVGDDWWPDHTRHLEITAAHCTKAFLDELRCLLSGEYQDYRIQLCVYVDPMNGKSYIGSMALYPERVLIEEKLELLLNDIEEKGGLAASAGLADQLKREAATSNDSNRLDQRPKFLRAEFIPPPWLALYALTYFAGGAYLAFVASAPESIYRTATFVSAAYCIFVGILLWISSRFALYAYMGAGVGAFGFAAYRMISDGFSTSRLGVMIGGLTILYGWTWVAEELQSVERGQVQ